MVPAMGKRRSLGVEAVAGLMLLALAGCGDRPRDRGEAPVDAQASIGDVIGLPDDSSLVAPPGSPQRELADFLASDDPAPRSFALDHNQFQPWSDTPNQQTRATIAAVIQILRAYPNAKLSILGYTDNVGDAAANQRLSESRAGNFRDLLMAGGISGNRIAAAGMGMANPIGDNDTEEGRALNRRLEMVVTAK